MPTDRGFHLLDDAVEAVEGAADVEEALTKLVGVIGERFDISAATVTRYLDDIAEIVAMWQSTPSQFEKGMRMSIHLTDDTRMITERLRAGGIPIIIHADDTDLGMIGDMIRSQGIRSGTLIPLWRGDVVAGVLALAGGRKDPFVDTMVPLFTGIGRGVEETLLRLAAQQP